MSDLRVGTRLALSFGVIVLFLIGLAAFTVVQLDRIQGIDRDLATRVVPMLTLAGDLVQGQLQQSTGIRGYVLTGDDQYLADYRQGVSSANRALDSLRTRVSTPDGSRLFQQMEQLSTQYQAQTDQIVTMVQAGNRDAASTRLQSDLFPLRKQLQDTTDQFINLQRQLYNQGTANAQAARNGVRNTTVGVDAAIALLCLLFGLLTTRSITRPVGRLSKAAEALGAGDFGPALSLLDTKQTGGLPPGGRAARDELVALAVGFARMAGLVQRRQKVLTDHAEVSDALASTLDLQQLSDAAAASLARAVGCEVAAVYLLDEEGQSLARMGSYALSGAAPTTYRLGEGLPGQAALSRRRVVVEKIPAQTPYLLDGGVGAAAPRTLVAAPLLSGDGVVGSIVLASLRELDEEALGFVDVAAQQMGVALSNARTHAQVMRLAEELRALNEELAAQNEEIQVQNEELQTQNEELQSQSEEIQTQSEEIQFQSEELQSQAEEIRAANEELQRQYEGLEVLNAQLAQRAHAIHRLQEVSQKVAGSLSLTETLDAIVEAVQGLFESSLTAVFLLEEDGYHFQVPAWRGLESAPAIGGEFHVDNTVAGWAVRAREPRYVEDLREMDTPVRLPVLEGGRDPRAILVAPMLSKDEVLGVVEVYFAEAHAFTTDEAKLLASLAHSAGVAVLNARLYERLLEHHTQLQSSSLEAQEAARLKSEFLANMSHELRTPLNSILSLATLLLGRLDGELTAEQERQVEIIRRNGEMLLGLINDVLELSRVESGKIEIRPAPFDVGLSLRQLEQMVRPLAISKGLRLEVAVDADLDGFCSDEERVRQIVLNLLSNAVKFTERGEVVLRVRQLALAADAESCGSSDGGGKAWSVGAARAEWEASSWGVAIEVRDSGVGIPANELERIFEEFTQANWGKTRSHGGSGLGLSIARKLSRMLGGEITVQSEVGRGSTFTVLLPCLRMEKEAQLAQDLLIR